MKRHYTLLTSASLLLAFAGGVLPQDFVQTVSAAEQAQDDAEKTGSIVFDEKTGTLTLSGNITAAEVQKYAKNEAVRAVVATEGCVFPFYCSSMFKNFCAESIDLSKADTSNVTDMSRMFENCRALIEVDLSGFDTTNVTDMIGMFGGCSSLTKLDLSGFDTANVKDMDMMFSNCDALTELNLFGFDTVNVTSMRNMFSGCYALTELDLSEFDTANVSDAVCMFANARKLKTIYVSDAWDIHNAECDDMFAGCDSLIGGNGTVYSDEHIDSEYARIDTADAPGYLTFKEKPAPQADWGNANCRDGVDVSDAVLLARYSAEDSRALLTAQGKINADVTHDGKIDGDDVTLILKYIVKLVPYSALKPTAENK